jgi:glycosyltransferase involved in cell wall biosynthesis
MHVCRKVLQGVREMQKKKLLIAADTFPPRIDGVSKFLQAVVPALTSDFDITILAPDFGPGGSDLENTPGVKVVKFRIGKKQWGDFRLSFPDISVLKKEIRGSELVFVQSIAPIGAATIFFAHLMKKKVVVYTHVIEWQIALKNVGVEGFAKVLSRWIVISIAKLLYNWCTLLINPSSEISEIFSNHRIGVKKVIIPVGVDNSRFKPPRDRRNSKRELSINPADIVVGYCGRLSKEKDLPTLHRAFLRLRAKYENLTLLIVGDGIPEIRALFKDKEHIYFAGMRNDAMPFFQAMDIFVMPSLTETSSLATMEAMACGAAVLSTNVGNIGDYLKNYKTGIFFKRRNSFDLSNKIDLLIRDEKLREQLSESGHREIVENYDWQKTIAELKKVLVPLCYDEPRTFFGGIGGRISGASGKISNSLKAGSEKMIVGSKEILNLGKQDKEE